MKIDITIPAPVVWVSHYNPSMEDVALVVGDAPEAQSPPPPQTMLHCEELGLTIFSRVKELTLEEIKPILQSATNREIFRVITSGEVEKIILLGNSLGGWTLDKIEDAGPTTEINLHFHIYVRNLSPSENGLPIRDKEVN